MSDDNDHVERLEKQEMADDEQEQLRNRHARALALLVRVRRFTPGSDAWQGLMRSIDHLLESENITLHQRRG